MTLGLWLVACGSDDQREPDSGQGGRGAESGEAGDAGRTAGDGGRNGGPVDGPGGQAGDASVLADLDVTVIDNFGRHVEGAGIAVLDTSEAAETSSKGHAVVRAKAETESVIAVEKAGFAEQVKAVRLAREDASSSLRVMLIEREEPIELESIEEGGSATGKHGVTVTFPASALVDEEGEVVSGTIELHMTPLDVTGPDGPAFPGAFEGTAPGTQRGALVSFGSVELVPLQDGKKLNLARGKEALVELPLYATAQPDGSPIRLGDEIDLWSLDPATGVWTREGSGTVVTSERSPTERAVRGKIGHFSWWNLDAFSERANVELTVDAPGQALPANTSVFVEGRVRAGVGPTSLASISSPLGVTRNLQVATPGTVELSARLETATEICEGVTSVSPSANTTIEARLDLTCSEVPVPSIVLPAEAVLTNGKSALSTVVQVTGPVPDRVELLADGIPIASTGPQFFYRFAWDASEADEGAHSLVARATLDDLTRDSEPLQVLVDRTAPRAVRIEPAASVQLDGESELTVEFDEPVNALPFALDDAVVLSVVRPGQAAPVRVAIDIALEASSTVLTVKPLEELPVGIATLAWGGLRDNASNPVTGTVAASWEVDASALLGDELPNEGFSFFKMASVPAITPDGRFLVAHRATGHRIVLSEYDAASGVWAEVTPQANDDTTFANLAFAIDRQEVPHLAFTQIVDPNTNKYEIVLKRLVASKWEEVAAYATDDSARNAGSLLVFDSQNRAVLTAPDGKVLRAASGAFSAIGSVTLPIDMQVRAEDDGTLFLAYIHQAAPGSAGGRRTCLAQIVGNGVQDLACPDTDPSTSRVRLAVVGGVPYLSFTRDLSATIGGVEVAVYRYDAVSAKAVAVPFPTRVTGLSDVEAFGDSLLLAADLTTGIVQVHRLRGDSWDPPMDATLRLRPDNFRLATQEGLAILTEDLGGATTAVQVLTLQ